MAAQAIGFHISFARIHVADQYIQIGTVGGVRDTALTPASREHSVNVLSYRHGIATGEGNRRGMLASSAH